VKAISLKQPWANLIASGQKTIETRLWGTDYRGELLIVSSKRPKIEPAGCAVAVAELIECRPMTLADERAALCEVYENAVAWVFRNVRPLKPFPVNGQLGIFDVDVQEDLLAMAPDRELFLTLFQEPPHGSQGRVKP
jgi:hypothetical protein